MTDVQPPAVGPLDDLIPLITRLAREAVTNAAQGPLAAPTWRPGSIQGNTAPGDDAAVLLDGDDGSSGTLLTAPNVCGAGLLTGDRVLVMFVPPHGVYITSALTACGVMSGSVVWNVAEDEADMPGHLAFGINGVAHTVLNAQGKYPTLWARTGATGWQSGTNLVLPDIGSRVIAARNADSRFDTTGKLGGNDVITLTAAQSGMPAHNVPLPQGGFWRASGSGVDAQGNYHAMQQYTSALSVPGQNASAPHSNLQPYIVLNPYLKT